MSRGPVVALAIVLVLAAGAVALLFLGGGGPRGEGDGGVPDGEAPAGVGAATAAADPRPSGGLAVGEPAPSGTGIVTLRVLDGDARVPLEGVSVSIAGRTAAGERFLSATKTNADGDAALEGVPAGDAYVVSVSRARARTIDRADVKVAEGETTDLGLFLTGAHGVVEGVVVDETGAPVEGARVALTLEPARLVEARDEFPRPRPSPRRTGRRRRPRRAGSDSRTSPSASWRCAPTPRGSAPRPIASSWSAGMCCPGDGSC
jgi:hypothetical protein